ncbi:MAG: hypothetical protein H0X30_34260, partial [Anaerolineae bacterium]|nr:hypothetical protein [Anaerolineae bacterium]
MCFLLLVGFSQSAHVLADDPPTETPTSIPTEIPPTVVPTDTPLPTETSTPTETPTEFLSPSLTPSLTQTDIFTETPTNQITQSTPLPSLTPSATATYAVSPTLTSTMTMTATQDISLTPEPPLSLSYSDNFDRGDFSHWNLGAGWSLVAHDSGYALQVFNSSTIAKYTSSNLSDVVAQSIFLLDNGTARIVVRQTATASYAVTLSAAGQVNLYRSGILMQTAAFSPSVYGQWRTLRLSAVSDTLRVAVDGIQVIVLRDVSPLPAGT